jgi:hypothetical protein
LQTPNARVCGLLGLVGGTAMSYAFSLQRFQGLRANEYEVQKYGAMKAEDTEDKLKRIKDQNLNLIDAPKREE